jgi:hypothetical protein
MANQPRPARRKPGRDTAFCDGVGVPEGAVIAPRRQSVDNRRGVPAVAGFPDLRLIRMTKVSSTAPDYVVWLADLKSRVEQAR